MWTRGFHKEGNYASSKNEKKNIIIINDIQTLGICTAQRVNKMMTSLRCKIIDQDFSENNLFFNLANVRLQKKSPTVINDGRATSQVYLINTADKLISYT